MHHPQGPPLCFQQTSSQRKENDSNDHENPLGVSLDERVEVESIKCSIPLSESGMAFRAFVPHDQWKTSRI